MGTVLASTLAVSFSALDLPTEFLERSNVPVERLVSTGGSELPDRIESVYAELASESGSAAQAAEARSRGERVAERVGAEVRETFALATTRIYWLTVVMALIAIVFALRIPELPLRTTHDRVAREPARAASAS
jgi:hypothetical protein